MAVDQFQGTEVVPYNHEVEVTEKRHCSPSDIRVPCQELFIPRKSMVLYVQLSTNSGLDNFYSVKKNFIASKAYSSQSTVAQMAEQATRDRKVTGSILAWIQ